MARLLLTAISACVGCGGLKEAEVLLRFCPIGSQQLVLETRAHPRRRALDSWFPFADISGAPFFFGQTSIGGVDVAHARGFAGVDGGDAKPPVTTAKYLQ